MELPLATTEEWTEAKLLERASEYEADRNRLLFVANYRQSLCSPDNLLDMVDCLSIDPTSAALLMCPVSPIRSTAYAKMIQATEAIFENYLEIVETMHHQTHEIYRIDAIRLLKRLWGIR